MQLYNVKEFEVSKPIRMIPFDLLNNLINLDRLWSSAQSSWLQIQRSEFDYLLYHIF
jgi:hypothetical protein